MEEKVKELYHWLAEEYNRYFYCDEYEKALVIGGVMDKMESDFPDLLEIKFNIRKFKIGDIIQKKNGSESDYKMEVTDICSDFYRCDYVGAPFIGGWLLDFEDENDYEIIEEDNLN